VGSHHRGRRVAGGRLRIGELLEIASLAVW
jgi:hypothetical protein